MTKEPGRKGRLKASKREFEVVAINAYTGKVKIRFSRQQGNYTRIEEVELTPEELDANANDA